MPGKVLVSYATQYGSTKEVAEAVAIGLRESGLEADLLPLREARLVAGYTAAVLGSPLMMGRWHKDLGDFLSRNRQVLGKLPVAVFSLGPIQNPRVEKEWQDAGDQLAKELARFPWLKPVATEILGGKFDPALLRFPFNKLAGAAQASDCRDWEAIRAWAKSLPEKFV
jgi:menaquinone-dependent protoporphyrinogen oxidase